MSQEKKTYWIVWNEEKKEFDSFASSDAYDPTTQPYDEPFRHVDTAAKPKRGRPEAGFDKRAYMKEYMRKRRGSKKASKA